MSEPRSLAACALLAMILCCTGDELHAQRLRLEIPLGLDLYLPIPRDNVLTPAKAELGRKLFFDQQLSRDGTIACASCHDPLHAFSNGLPLSRGISERIGRRNVPSLVNRGYGRQFFWDGRARTLEDQVLKPIEDPNEMDTSVADLVARLNLGQEYRAEFRAAFRRDPDREGLARALASYVRTILSGNAPIDRYLAGDSAALSPQAQEGFELFRGKANCSACHPAPAFTDEFFHNTGVAWKDGRFLDEGRAAVTGNEEDRAAFKTPTLREIPNTAPYMHDGSIATIEKVIEFYDRGGNDNPFRDRAIRRLGLTEKEKGALRAFLYSLQGDVRDGIQPAASRRP
jgi:cytochrome c peroxidase